jgi:signal transduction histidine kinase/CheY-like chemotaxis protein
VIAGATLVPCIALWALLIASLWRLGREEDAWNQWNQEASIRASLEAAQRESYRLETLGNLVGSVAHDFNNLLMTISVNVQIGQRRGEGALSKELDAIGRAVRGGEGLTRRLLGVARKQPLRARTLEQAEWSGDFSLVKAALGDAIEFVVDIAPDAWPVHADLSELELALINVAVNARDAMTTGGTFRIRAQNVQFPKGVMADLVGDFLTISLEDTGVGMTPEVANHAFEPLFTTKSMGMGTGLGLAQVYSFCRQANGAVTLHSVLGKGTTVKLYLPRAAAQEEDDVPARPADKAVDAGQRILLVEDHRDMAEAEQALLEILGYQVELAYDAQQALDKLAGAGHFDLVLSDVEMPGGMSGIDLAMRLRSERPGLPVILVTGYARELEKIRDQGLSVFSKPLDIEALQRHMAELLAPA